MSKNKCNHGVDFATQFCDECLKENARLSDSAPCTGSIPTTDVGVVLCAPVANVLFNRAKKHGLNTDQYLYQLMKKYDLGN